MVPRIAAPLGCIVAAGVLTACVPEIHPFFDLSNPGYGITQTFGQLIGRGGFWRPAEYVVIKTPPSAVIRTPVTGVVSYVSDFHGLGPSLIVTPKTYLSSDTDFDHLEGMPNPAGIRLVYGNLIEAEVEAKIGFIAMHPDNRDIEVTTGATLAENTELAVAQDDTLYVAAFLGDPDAITEWVNPLPFLAAGIPSASLSLLDNSPPVIKSIALYADQDAAMVSPMIYEVPEAATGIEPPNILFGNLAIQVEVEDRVRAGGENIGIYELAYEMNLITRDATDFITSRSLVASGRHLANRIDASDPPLYADLYNSVRSSAELRTFWYRLHFDPTAPSADPEVRNYTSTSNPHSLDISSFGPGENEYELVLKVRDVLTDRAAPVTRTIYAHINNAPSAIASAQWKLRATAGTETAEVDRNDQLSFLILPGGVPPPIQTTTLNAPAGSYCSSIQENGGTPTTGPYTSPAPISFSQAGLHELVVWLDENADCVRQASESSRRIVVMTYQLSVSITGERKHLGPTYGPPQANSPPNPPIASSDGLRLTVAATGFPDAATEALANFSWEVAGPKGPELTPLPVWEKDPKTYGGRYVAKGVVELFGVRFEATWEQDVISASIAPVAAICENEQRPVAVVLQPAPLPTGQQVDYSIDRPGNLANGNATFTDGSVAATGNVAGNVALRGVTVSNAKDNVALIAQYDGAEIAREPFSVCAIQLYNRDRDLTDSLIIARWENAYNAAVGFRVFNAAASNFVDRDENLFYVRVLDASRNLDPGAPERIEGEIGTLDAVAVNSDDNTRLQLFETGNNTGIFESTAQLLTSPDLPPADSADDDFPVNDGNNHLKPDDTLNDRTHRTSVDGRLALRYRPDPAGASYQQTFAVCRAGGVATCDRAIPGTPCVFRLRVRVFLEPHDDVGYGNANGVFDSRDANGNGRLDAGESEPFADANGDGLRQGGEAFTDAGYGSGNNRFDFTDANGNLQHDAGERSERFIDFSGGATVMGLAGARGGVVDGTHVGNQINRARIAWGQACVTIEQVGSTQFIEAPNDPFGANILADGNFTASSTLHPIDDDSVVAQRYAAAASVDVLEVFFVARYPGGNAYTAIPDYTAGAEPAFGEKTFAFIEERLNLRNRTLAHEIGHALTNRWDPSHYGAADNQQFIFFPKDVTQSDNSLARYRRLSAATVGNARALRPTGSLHAVGSRLLRNP